MSILGPFWQIFQKYFCQKYFFFEKNFRDQSGMVRWVSSENLSMIGRQEPGGFHNHWMCNSASVHIRSFHGCRWTLAIGGRANFVLSPSIQLYILISFCTSIQICQWMCTANLWHDWNCDQSEWTGTFVFITAKCAGRWRGYKAIKIVWHI